MGLLGAHMSIAGGLHKAIERGDDLLCEAIQIFVQSSRTWEIPPLSEDDIKLFRKTLKGASTVKRVVAHNSYLLNLSTANTEARKKSVRYFIETLKRCEMLGIEGLITHPGSHLGAGEKEGIRLTTKSLDEVLKACKGFRSRIILENTAGQGDCIGHRFEQLAEIVDNCSDPGKIGFCFDTQHAFAAGYDLRSPEGYAATFEMWDHYLGLRHIKAFHLNDALKELGCRVDRHQNIGEGFLGAEAFRPLVNDVRFAKVPMCLETDPGEDSVNYRRELALLHALVA